MRVLITGDRGFIGTKLLEAYRKIGAQVLGWSTGGIYGDRKGHTHGDLLDQSIVRQVLEGYSPEIILHCAGNADVGRSMEHPTQDLESNYMTTHNLLFGMKELSMYKCRFLLMSSAAVYGNPASFPVTEQEVADPLSPYALHKKAAEDICLYMQKNYGFDTKILRIFSAYGPGLKKQIFWDMFQKVKKTGGLDLWGNGEESRDYIYIDDLVQAIMLVARKAPYGEIFYNVANCEEIKIKDAAYIFARNMDLDEKKVYFIGKRREGDPVNWKGDNRKLMSLGYKRKFTFEDGIKEYIGWLKMICG